MKKYYTHNSKEQSGPFTLEELAKENITTKTMIWYQGLADWTSAAQLEELKDVIQKKQAITLDELQSPPPFKKKNQFVKIGLIIVGVIVFIFLICRISHPHRTNTQNPLDSLVVIENPSSTAFYSDFYKKWLLDVNGKIMNKSSVCTYKDFVITVNYESRTGTVLATRKYTIFQTIKPLEVLTIRRKIEDVVPQESYYLKWKLIGAAVVKKQNDKK